MTTTIAYVNELIPTISGGLHAFPSLSSSPAAAASSSASPRLPRPSASPAANNPYFAGGGINGRGDPEAAAPAPAVSSVAGCLVGGRETTLAGEFSRVSEDMKELVFHLDQLQPGGITDISELAGRPISVYDNS